MLEQVLNSEADQLASFGVERVTRADGLWFERLTIRGDGHAHRWSTRSFGEASGEEIGGFESELEIEVSR